MGRCLELRMAGAPAARRRRAGRDHWLGLELPPFPSTGLVVIFDSEIMQTCQGWMYEAAVVAPGSCALAVGEVVAVKVWRHDAMAAHLSLSRAVEHKMLGPDRCPLADYTAVCNEDAEAEQARRAHRTLQQLLKVRVWACMRVLCARHVGLWSRCAGLERPALGCPLRGPRRAPRSITRERHVRRARDHEAD